MVRPTLSVVAAREVSDDEFDSGLQHEWPAEGLQGAFTTIGRQPDDDFEPRQLSSVVGDSDWVTRAVCAGSDPDALFVTGAAQREAARLCQACPVRLECLADALDNQIEYGVWGGMTERQRRAVLKKSPEVVSWRALLEEARAGNVRDEAS
jgi:WhiB family redox-sensing transcriptional regulator